MAESNNDLPNMIEFYEKNSKNANKLGESIVGILNEHDEERYLINLDNFCATLQVYIHAYNLLNFDCTLFDPKLKKKEEALIQNIAENTYKIINIIHTNRKKLLPEKMAHIDIECKEFKDICNTIICLPQIYPMPLSGVYIIFLYYKSLSKSQDIDFIWKTGLLKDVPEDDQKNDKYYDRMRKDYKQKIFFSNTTTYLSDFEKKLFLSMNKIECSRLTKLWKLLDLYGYATHDISGNLHKRKNIISSPLIAARMLTGGSVTDIPSMWKGKIFFLTVLFQKMTDDDRSKMNDMFSKLRISVQLFQTTYRQLLFFLKTIITVDQSVGFQDAEKYQKIMDDFRQWLNNKTVQKFRIGETDMRPLTMPIIDVMEENLYQLVYWRMILTDSLFSMESPENILSFQPIICNHNPQLRLYLASNPYKEIDVDEWSEFKAKYKYQLNGFFPDIDDVFNPKYGNEDS